MTGLLTAVCAMWPCHTLLGRWLPYPHITLCVACYAGAYLDPVCPVLPATVLAADRVEVDRQQVFNLPVQIQDAFGSQPDRGPGSDWQLTLTLQPQHSEGSAGEVSLSGATVGALSGGQGILQGLMILAPPGQDVRLLLQASPAQAQQAGQVSAGAALVGTCNVCLLKTAAIAGC